MTQELIDYPDGLWAIDMDLIQSIVRSHIIAEAQLRYSETIVSEKWFGPDVHSFVVDWDKVDREKRLAPQKAWDIHCRAQQCGMRPELQRLEQMVIQTRTNRNKWASESKAAMSRTMANIDQSVSRAKIGKEVATAIRDVSAGTLAVGATVLSGGTAAGLVGAATFSSGVDSLITLQDTSASGDPRTGNLKAAGFTFVSKFAINLIPAGKGSDKLFMFILKNEAEVLQAGGQALVEGKTMEQALIKSFEQAGAQVLGAGAGKLLRTPTAHKLLSRSAYPMTLRVNYPAKTYLGRMRQTKDFTVGVAGKVVDTAGKVAIGATSNALTSKPSARPPSKQSIADNAVLLDERLLNHAVQGPNKSEWRSLVG